MEVLGIGVSDSMVGQWRDWLMPAHQPYLVPQGLADEHGWRDGRRQMSFEVLDAFELYHVTAGQAVVHLTRREASRLPPEVRRAQPTPHRWPSGDDHRDRSRAVRYVESRRRASRHRSLTDSDWATAAAVLPGARALAGTFASGSGPNCFGTVMAAAGVAGAAEEWMQIEPFETWLAGHARAGGDDDAAGTVLVWRTADGAPAHAAVTLGGGWLMHKPSQGWMSPIKVLTVQDGKYSARSRGHYLHRYDLTAR